MAWRRGTDGKMRTEHGTARPLGPQALMIFRLGGIQFDWAHPQLEEGVARHGVLPNQQMKAASVRL